MLRQILCMHSRLPYETNPRRGRPGRIPPGVCGVDLLGPDALYEERIGGSSISTSMRAPGPADDRAFFETANSCHPELQLSRTGLGMAFLIPLRHPELLPQLAERDQSWRSVRPPPPEDGHLQSL